MGNKNEKQILAKEALKALAEIEEQTKLEDLVKDNKIEFSVNNVIYRVRKPNSIERQEVDIARRKKYLELVKDDSFLFRKQWIKIYKEKGIDIDEMENKVRILDGEIKDLLLRLAQSTEPNDISKLKEEILKKRDEQFSTSIEITDLLAHSIENTLLIFVNSYITYLVFEKKVGENWIRAYKSYEEFMQADDKAIEQAFYYMNLLVYSNPIKIEENK